MWWGRVEDKRKEQTDSKRVNKTLCTVSGLNLELVWSTIFLNSHIAKVAKFINFDLNFLNQYKTQKCRARHSKALILSFQALAFESSEHCD
eukprot:g62059.t1